MTTTSYARLGQAFQALANYSFGTGYVAPTNSAGLTYTWTPASGSTPGFFTYTSTTPAISNQYNVLESLGKPNVALAYLASQPEFSQAYTVNSAAPASGKALIQNFCGGLGAVLEAAVKDMTGTTAGTLNSVNLFLSGNSGTSLSACINWVSVSTTWDLQTFNVVVYNTFYNNATYAMNLTGFPRLTAPTTVNVASVAPVVTINEGSPIDGDIAINSGQAIYSIVSKTTTILP